MDLPPLDTLQKKLEAHRAAADRRRAEAFCPGLDTVLGLRLRPLTPRTYSMLFATGSRFIHGGAAFEGDVRNYFWFHSRLFTTHPLLAPLAKRLALFRLTRALRRRAALDYYAAAVALAVAEIREHVDAAFADAPLGSGTPGVPVATLEAQLVHEFATAYHWPAERTIHTPLRQLFQLERCILVSRGADLIDRGEIALKRAHLQQRNAALAAERAASAAA